VKPLEGWIRSLNRVARYIEADEDTLSAEEAKLICRDLRLTVQALGNLNASFDQLDAPLTPPRFSVSLENLLSRLRPIVEAGSSACIGNTLLVPLSRDTLRAIYDHLEQVK
jgi:hypothetical protein